MKPTWTVAPKASAEFFNAFPETPPLAVQVLWNRGIRNTQEALQFLHPDIERDLHNPFLFVDMQKAVARIQEAFEKKEKIAIWGDYDCDGVCGSSVLFTVFRDMGHEHLVNVHIPDRNKEGYGLTTAHLEELYKEGVKLVITVDCGITDVREIAWAMDHGMDVIIADHHSVPVELPAAYAILNPKDARSGYPFPGLAGTGVAFKLACALLSSSADKISVSGLPKEGEPRKLKFNLPNSASGLLDLVALATLADSMPLRNENRVMVQNGLSVLKETGRPGLRALIEFCDLTEGFSVRDVHFSLIPRLNAMGRMDHASVSFRLLTTSSPEEIPALIRHLDERNRERQLVCDVIVEEVLGRLAQYPQKPTVVFESSPRWVPGVLGLAAQRVMQEVGRPVVLAIEDEKSGRVVGNGRALGAFNIVKVLQAHPELFSDAGGHPHAGGFTTTSENLARVRSIFLQEGEEALRGRAQAEEHMLLIDAELAYADITEKTYTEIEKLSPFGEENAEPQFLFRGLKVSYMRTVGKGNHHLKLRLLPASPMLQPSLDSSGRGEPPDASSTAPSIDAIGFGLGGRADELSQGSTMDVIARLSRNSWNGRKTIELQVMAIAPVSSFSPPGQLSF